MYNGSPLTISSSMNMILSYVRYEITKKCQSVHNVLHVKHLTVYCVARCRIAKTSVPVIILIRRYEPLPGHLSCSSGWEPLNNLLFGFENGFLLPYIDRVLSDRQVWNSNEVGIRICSTARYWIWRFSCMIWQWLTCARMNDLDQMYCSPS